MEYATPVDRMIRKIRYKLGRAKTNKDNFDHDDLELHLNMD